MLWCDKYRPKQLNKFLYSQDLNNSLINIVQKASIDGTLPHLLFYGPSGGGKRSRIRAFLREIFNFDIEKTLKLETKDIQCTDSKKITISLLQSNNHIEVDPSEYGVYDRYVISNLVKELAQAGKIQLEKSNHPFKIIVLNNVDHLSQQAQAALRRTMEKYTRNCRIILCASSISNVIPPVKSRCLCIRVPLPNKIEIVQVLKNVAEQENLVLPINLAESIADSSEGNLRQALMLLESTYSKNKDLKNVAKPDRYNWDLFIQQIANEVLEQQSPKKLLEIREKFFKLTTHSIPSDLIFRKLVDYLIGNIQSTEMKHSIIHDGAVYERRMKLGSRSIFHLEAFIAKVMADIKKPI